MDLRSLLRSLRFWNWKRPSLVVVALVAVIAVLGALFVVAGLAPIKASSRHWAITSWALNFAKERAVATQSIGVTMPPLDDDRLVLWGAGHYQTACVMCHGAPGAPPPVVPHGMTPPPPSLPERIQHYSPAELFSIVKHGIKFTGMPGWPTQQRDDEVHAMIAFLLELPDLTPAAYRGLVLDTDRLNTETQGTETQGTDTPGTDTPGTDTPGTDTPGSDRLDTARLAEGGDDAEARARPLDPSPRLGPAALCARCHGEDGGGRGLGAFPKLAGQRPEYLRRALEAYASGARPSGVMQPLAAPLTEAEIEAIARHYASLPPVPSTRILDAAAVERGRRVVQQGVPERRVPSCQDCHGPDRPGRSEAYPSLAGQYAEYLVTQLHTLKKGRGGSAYVEIMHEVVDTLDEQQMQDVAAYYESLPP